MPEPSPRPLYRFGPFTLDPANRRLARGSDAVPIAGRAFDILVVLVGRPGELVEKGALIEQVWGDVAVEEGNLTRNVSTLRRILDDDSELPRYVATVAGRGYQFVAPVEVVSAGRAETQPVPAPAPMATPVAASAPFSASPIVWIIAAVLVLAVGGAAWTLRGAGGDRKTTRILVLPFENLIGNPGEDAVADGLTEETIVELGRLDPSHLVVVARTTAMNFKGQHPSLATLRSSLDADLVLEGSLRRDGSVYRVAIALVDARQQSAVWTQSFDRRTDAVLVVQQELAGAIARQVRIELTPDAEARLARVRTTNFEAHRQYADGRHLLSLGTEQDIRQAIVHFERAVALDPGYALAHTGLADASIALTDYYVSPDETRGLARSAAARAVELDGSLAEAHTSLATVRLLFDWDWQGAEREYERAIALQPGYADAHTWYAYYLALMGRAGEAAAQAKVAEDLDPRSVFVQLNASWIYFLARQPGESAAHARRALEIDPSGNLTHSSIWLAYAPTSAFLRQAQADPSHVTSLGVATLAGAAATAGRREEAQRLLSQLEAMPGYVCPYEVASAEAALGHRDKAFDALERAYAERSPCIPDIKVDPRFDMLRNDPRMDSILQRMHLR